MKSRTLISLCQRPDLNPFHGEVTPWAALCVTVVGIIELLLRRWPLGTRLDEAEHDTGVSGDHQFFVGGNDPRGNRAPGSRDSRVAARVGMEIEVDTQPG